MINRKRLIIMSLLSGLSGWAVRWGHDGNLLDNRLDCVLRWVGMVANQTIDEQVERALAFIRDKAKELAQAKAERVYLEEFRKSKKAMLIQEASDKLKTAQERESYAYSHKDYLQILEALKIAVEKETFLQFSIKASELKFEQWRTIQANRRLEFGRYGNN